MDTIHFNTKRMYSAKGQRISATEYPDGKITFYDHDRMIDGELPVGFMLSERGIMDGYDHMMHKSTHQSRMDGMYEGGPNRTYVE